MNARKRAGLAVLSAALVAPWALAAEPLPLGKAEVQKLLTGKSMVIQYVDPIQLELSEKGSFKALATASAIRAIGTWSVDDQGRLCMKSPNPLLTGCRTVQRGDRGLGMSKTDGTGFFAISELR